MKKSLLPLMFGALLVVAGCSGDDAATTDSVPQIGVPDPALPSEVNAIPYVLGSVAGAGNVEVRVDLPDTPSDVGDDVFVLEVTVTSGALEPFSIIPDMFRVYTVDGKSYTPEAVGTIAQFGTATLNTGEAYTGLMAVTITTDSEPAMFLADFTDIGDRFFAAAFSVDPEFVPQSPEG
jgi:hypothetical protein